MPVNKTQREKNLNRFYMRFIRAKRITPKYIIDRFMSDIEKVKETNYIYQNENV